MFPRSGPPPAARAEARVQAEARVWVLTEARVRVEAQVRDRVEAQALVAAEVLAEVRFQVAGSAVGAPTVAPAAESVALPPVGPAVVVSPPHSAASPLLPSLPPPKTSLDECHRCRKGEKMQSEVLLHPRGALSSALLSRLPGLVGVFRVKGCCTISLVTLSHCMVLSGLTSTQIAILVPGTKYQEPFQYHVRQGWNKVLQSPDFLVCIRHQHRVKI